jgi:formylglycine-generating enzyme required for sulfatase activity
MHKIQFRVVQAGLPRLAVVAVFALLAGTAPAQEPPAPGSAFRDCPTCQEMVVLPTGQYGMGAPPLNQGRPYAEGELRRVEVTEPFAIGKFEVTFDEWEACVRDKRCEAANDEGWGRGKRPVINVSWEQAAGYAKWLAKKTGKPYRLPTEAEWEYAARAGADRGRFFNIAPGKTCEYANLYDLTGKAEHEYEWENVPCKDGFSVTAPVGSFKPNAFGLHDMLGNVWEWTEDCLSAKWRGMRNDTSALIEGDCSQRAFRGGSWLNFPPYYIYFADRYKFLGARHNDLGFRVARDLP